MSLGPRDIARMTYVSSIALMAATELPHASRDAEIPKWVHILPTGNGPLKTVDGRGPYYARDLEAIVVASMAEGDIAIDQDHALMKTGKHGVEAPARGWITEMEVREDGIWGLANWTAQGADLVASKTYRKLSPVIQYTAGGNIVAIREVSLVNRPNLRGMVALNSEETPMLNEQLITLLGLEENATDAQILAAAQAAMNPAKGSDKATHTGQSELDRIADAVGLQAGSSTDDIIIAAQAAQSGQEHSATKVEAMQAQIDAMVEKDKRKSAEMAVDDAIRKGHAGIKPKRNIYISMHMQNPEQTADLMSGLPTLADTHTGGTPRSGDVETAEMSASDIAEKAAAYTKKCADEGRIITAAQAVEAVQEGKA